MTDQTVKDQTVKNSRVTLGERLEALLIIAEEPVSVMEFATALDEPVESVKEALLKLQKDYDGQNEALDGGPKRGFELREIAGGYRLYSREEHNDLVISFVHADAPAKLSQAALETLAVIAYKQPITRGAIASIRAVNVDSVVRTLVNRGLVNEVGNDPVTGAVLYGTTNLLLEQLGLVSIEDLPPIAPLLDDGLEGFEGEQETF
ncbi:MAG TPA: SMC-Scp complex subunit ScpB [Microbacteriaceae bacterium]|nr:SMC-Scp complex subunit ScpB [Microbacteriaceae bacterium]